MYPRSCPGEAQSGCRANPRPGQRAQAAQRLLGQLARQDLLILDELGYVPFTKAGSELLFEVVSQAYERQSLVVTTNLPFEQWVEVCGSERLTGAMLDRLTHRVHIVEANGQSYRLRDGQRRLRTRRRSKAAATASDG